MGLTAICDGIEYNPENEWSSDMDHNKGKSVKERGFHADENGDIYEPGPFQRKNKYGRAVSHQDSQTFPGNEGLEV